MELRGGKVNTAGPGQGFRAELLAFLKKYKWALIFAFLSVMVCYGFMLTNYSLTIDEETWIRSTNTNSAFWLMQGRFGIYLFNRLVMPSGGYIPFLWDFLGVAFWFCAGVLFAFGFSFFYQKAGRFAVFAFCAMFPSIPLVAGELLSFSMFSLQQGLAMLVTACAALCIFQYFRARKTGFLVLSALLVFLASSFYQGFPVVYFTALMAYAVIAMYQNDERKVSGIVKNVLLGVCALAVGVVLYFIVNACISTFAIGGANSAGYLTEGFLGWGKAGAGQILTTAVKMVGKALLGIGVYGGKVLFAVLVLFTATAVAVCIQRKKNRFLWLLACALLIVSPFAMNLLLGTQGILGRTLLAFPLAIGVEVFLAADIVKNGKVWLKAAAYVIICCLLLANSAYMNQFFFNSYTVYQQDKATANQIMHDIQSEGMDTGNKPVVFVGKHDGPYQYAPAGSAANGSFFSWDGGNNLRMVDFIRTEGYDILYCSEEQLEKGSALAREMPDWPEKGSIRETEDCIIVRFSEPDEAWLDLNMDLIKTVS